MSFRDRLSRRTVLRSTAVAAAGIGLAGCSGDGGDGGDDGSGDDGSGDDGSGDGNGGDPPSFDGFMDDVSNYDGVVDETGSDEVTVEVGVEANDGNFGFGPPAIRVDAGTTVVWEWTGMGSSHNVVHEGGDYESELTDEEGFTFSHTFESSGTSKYACTPHRSLGMKGVVVVEG